MIHFQFGSDFYTDRKTRLNLLRDMVTVTKLICAMEETEYLFTDDTELSDAHYELSTTLQDTVTQLLSTYEDFKRSVDESEKELNCSEPEELCCTDYDLPF